MFFMFAFVPEFFVETYWPEYEPDTSHMGWQRLTAESCGALAHPTVRRKHRQGFPTPSRTGRTGTRLSISGSGVFLHIEKETARAAA